MAGFRRGPAGPAALALAAVLLLSACGIEPQRSPEPVPGDRLPAASESPTQAGASRGRVWGARDSRLVPVFVELPDDGTAGRVRALLALAEPEQRPPTALRPGTRLLDVERNGDTVVLVLSKELDLVPVTELPLALGQLVFTATEQPGVRRVHVRSGEVAVRYVDATGRTIARALVRPDFAGLVEDEEADATS